MIARRTTFSRSTGPIFAIFSLNENLLGADDRSGPLFFRYLKGCCHGNRFCEKMANSPLLSLWHSETEWYRYFIVRINSVNDASISCKNFVNFGPVTPELTELICERLVRHDHKTGVFSRTWTYFRNLFTIWKQSTLDADDGSVPYFTICQGTLPWQPNNVGWNEKVMKVDW